MTEPRKTPRTDACEGSDGTVRICDDLAELVRTLEIETQELAEALDGIMNLYDGPKHKQEPTGVAAKRARAALAAARKRGGST